MTKKNDLCPKKVGFWSLLKKKWAGLKPSVHAGSRGLWSKTHFYYQLKKKKKKILYNI